MAKSYGHLFSTGPLKEILDKQSSLATSEIDSIPRDVLLNQSIEQIGEALLSKYSIQEIVLNKGKIWVSQPYDSMVQDGLQIDPFGHGLMPGRAKGTAWEVHIPFIGDGKLLYRTASTYSYSLPYGSVERNELIFEIQKKPSDEQFSIDGEIDKKIEPFEKFISWTNKDIKSFNESLISNLQGIIQKRKSKVIKDWETTALSKYSIQGLGASPGTYTVELKKRVEIEQSSSGGKCLQLEPALSMSEYERILTILSNMVEVFERDPVAFEHSDEETIRTHFLAQLTGTYAGTASGETFNKEGKTDIFLRENGRAVFIAECKFWGGEKLFSETIDQLLGYLTWRETKVAIILLNRNKEFTKVLEKIQEAITTHGNFIGGYERRAENVFRARVSNKDDARREIILTILAFDVPRAE